MSFLERLDSRTRERFEAFGSPVTLMAGSYLLRRGDAGGDLFLLQEGTLEVLDTSGGAPMILAVLGQGAVVGEVSFLDDAPRTADVRAREGCRILKWALEDVRGIVEREPQVAARLFEEMARTLALRVRNLNDVAMPRPDARSGGLTDVGSDQEQDANDLIERAKEGLELADAELRARPYDRASVTGVRHVLDRLSQDLRALYASRPSAETARTLSRRIRRELRPWLARSALAERCLRERVDQVVGVEVIEQVLADVSRGEGLIGTHIDRWLLDRPALAGRRHADPVHIEAVSRHVGPGRGRAMLLDALVPQRLGELANLLAPLGGALVVVDPSLESLEGARAYLAKHDPPLTVQTVQEGVVQLAVGRVDANVAPVDVVLFYNLLSYLPDRIATSVLRWGAEQLVSGGCLIANVLDDGEDEPLLAHLLGWPSVRRAPARVQRLAASAGLQVSRTTPVLGPVSVLELVPKMG